MFTCAWLSGASVLLLFQLTARADPPAPLSQPGGVRAGEPVSGPEQQAFAQGLRLFVSGDARGAEREWQAGYAFRHDPAFLVRIGEAEEREAAPAEAVRSYERYLRESPAAADREEIEARISRLSAGRATAGSSPGKAPDAEKDAENDSPTGTSKRVSGEIPPGARGAASSAAAGGPAVGSPQGSIAPRRQPAEDSHDEAADELRSFVGGEPGRSRLNVAGWVGSAVTVALLGVAAFYAASASGKEGDINRLLGYRNEQTGMPVEYATVATTFEEDMRVGRRDDRLAKGLALAAGATALASAVLFVIDGLRGAPEDPATRLTLSMSPEQGAPGLRLLWSLRR
jgi:hypothetical protein